jgi:hypothetical protein
VSVEAGWPLLGKVPLQPDQSPVVVQLSLASVHVQVNWAWAAGALAQRNAKNASAADKYAMRDRVGHLAAAVPESMGARTRSGAIEIEAWRMIPPKKSSWGLSRPEIH